MIASHQRQGQHGQTPAFGNPASEIRRIRYAGHRALHHGEPRAMGLRHCRVGCERRLRSGLFDIALGALPQRLDDAADRP